MTSNTYTFPAEIVPQLPTDVGASIYVAVRGDRDCPPDVLVDLMTTSSAGPPKSSRWGQLCATCEGSGCDIDFCRSCDDEYDFPCGRHDVHISGTDDDGCCVACAGTGRALLAIQYERPDAAVRYGYVRPGTTYGLISDFRRWTVDALLPVMGMGDGPPEYGAHVRLPGTNTWLCGSDGSLKSITVLGNPQPGGYIVALTLVSGAA